MSATATAAPQVEPAHGWPLWFEWAIGIGVGCAMVVMAVEFGIHHRTGWRLALAAGYALLSVWNLNPRAYPHHPRWRYFIAIGWGMCALASVLAALSP